MAIIRNGFEHKELNASDIEISVAHYFGIQSHIIVPNVSWGWNLKYEADLVVLTQNNVVYEVEIKTSVADIKADLKKQHQHDSNKFRRLYFAIPLYILDKAVQYIPERAGILSINSRKYCITERAAKLNKLAKKIEDHDLIKLLRLSNMRIWTLKEHNAALALQNRNLREQNV
jgi:hypothetical protein